jgi:hypothetical protein
MSAEPNTKGLEPPPSAITNADAVEVLRAWIVAGDLHVSLQKAFDDPAVWGVMLVDIARHAARIYAREGDYTEDEAFSKILAIMDAEITNPTDVGTTKPNVQQ